VNWELGELEILLAVVEDEVAGYKKFLLLRGNENFAHCCRVVAGLLVT
jgi:hypothetical protein